MPRPAGPPPLDDVDLPSPFDSPPTTATADRPDPTPLRPTLRPDALACSLSTLAHRSSPVTTPDGSVVTPPTFSPVSSAARLDSWSPSTRPHSSRSSPHRRRRAKTSSTPSTPAATVGSTSSSTHHHNDPTVWPSRRRSSGAGPRPFVEPLTPMNDRTPASSPFRDAWSPVRWYRAHDDTELPHATKMQMSDYLRRLEHLFNISPQRCRILVDAFIDTLEMGLKEDGHAVPMIPTWVFGWPKGEEKGEFLAVDLGGTNLRVCHVELEGEGKFGITQAKYRLSEEQKQEDGEKLFDFCAECLGKFIQDHYGEGDEDEENGKVELEADLALGFTFSYPCVQKRIDHGELLRWTKGFGAANVEGHDVADMFAKSLKKAEVPIKVTALINDTTGTLMASHYVDPTTRIGVIFGTGCNAAYMERVSAIPKIASLGLPPDAEMAINCEWGAFDSETHEHLPRTKYDVTIDEQSNKPGQQAFEKMIAGLYLGEIFRLVVGEMVEEGVLFLGQNTYKMEKPYAFDTAFLSLIENDTTDELLTVTGLFTHFFGLDTTISERQFFRRLAQLIGTRAARLSAVGVAAIVSKQGLLDDGKEVGVATDGSLYNKYPKFPERMHEALVDIFGEKGKLIKSYHAEDGSGVGAAIIAAMTAERRAKGEHDHV